MNSIEFHFIEDCPAQMIRLSKGMYLFEAWGASGGCGGSISTSGKGAYAKGMIKLKTGATFYAFVGGSGQNSSKTEIPKGGCNGGGLGGNSANGYYRGSGGGGASDIRLNESLESRILIASGGGGSSGIYVQGSSYKGGDGGDEFGILGAAASATKAIRPIANQTFGYELGVGQNGRNTTYYYNFGAEGSGGSGGGLYGGFTYNETGNSTTTAGSSGSSFVSKEYFYKSKLISGSKQIKSPEGIKTNGNYGDGFIRITPLCYLSNKRPYYQVSKSWTIITFLMLS